MEFIVQGVILSHHTVDNQCSCCVLRMRS